MASDTFLVLKPKTGLPPFKTETQDSTFSKYVSLELKSFALGYAQLGTLNQPGKLSFHTLDVNLAAGINSPGFLAMAGRGQSFDSMTIYARRAGSGGPGPIYAVYHFGTIFVAGATMDGTSGDNAITLSLSLTFGELAHYSLTQSSNGRVSTALVGSWDVVRNTVWSPEPNLDGPGLG